MDCQFLNLILKDDVGVDKDLKPLSDGRLLIEDLEEIQQGAIAILRDVL